MTNKIIETPKFGVHGNLSLVLPSLNVGFVRKYYLLVEIFIRNIFIRTERELVKYDSGRKSDKPACSHHRTSSEVFVVLKDTSETTPLHLL